jgi:hypothetical protein
MSGKKWPAFIGKALTLAAIAYFSTVQTIAWDPKAGLAAILVFLGAVKLAWDPSTYEGAKP